MHTKIIIPGEITFVFGILLISFAIPLMVNAEFGISTISSLPFVLSRIWNQISFGIWNPLFQVGLLILLLAITKRFKSGYLISIVLSVFFGMSIDLFTQTLSGLPSEFWERILYFVFSFGIMCVGISLMVGSKIPLMVIDTFLNDLTLFYHVTYRRIKTIFDIICVTLSVALSFLCLGHLEGVGIGTIIMACITGFGVQAVNTVLSRVIIIRPWSRRLEEMVQ
ncbi:DUF6198 family protein [Methanospirillum stamsii]|uniref:YitT family protein n=1 Tax=Methanospirillum stamsii TaxID=1277351 RepID=A0A2V2NH36_9EURY|nr:DUF6198 family protein [Methanospirillum stamsii]PWR74921.1 hypothetical protein DLD82_06750 [Methanospirillum stamsii]